MVAYGSSYRLFIDFYSKNASAAFLVAEQYPGFQATTKNISQSLNFNNAQSVIRRLRSQMLYLVLCKIHSQVHPVLRILLVQLQIYTS